MDSVIAKYNGNILIITIAGKFTLPFFKEFYTAYKSLQVTPLSVEVDLKQVEYIDGIGFGMLLSMRNYFGADMPMHLQNANATVSKNLRIAGLDKYYVID
jgi:anti-anti-sigma factor